MKRFVTYIYEYDGGARGRNVGFVRTDIRNDGCRMDLHIRGLNCSKAKATIYFVIANAPVIGIPVAEMIISQGVGQAKLMCPQGNIGSSGYHTDQIDAIVIRYHSGQILVSSLVPEPDEEVLHGNFRMWDELEPDTPVASENTPPPTPDENTPTPPTQPNPVTDVQRNPSVPTPGSIENTSPVEILPDTPPNHTTAVKTKVRAGYNIGHRKSTSGRFCAERDYAGGNHVRKKHAGKNRAGGICIRRYDVKRNNIRRDCSGGNHHQKTD